MRNSVLSILLTAMMVYQTLARSANIDRFNLFSTDIYKELKKSETGNFAVSPISAQTILALVHEAAKGETATQLSTALHIPESREEVQGIFRELTTNLQSTEKYTLSSANKVYVKDGYEIKDEFKKLAEDDFHAEVEKINFEKKGAVDDINNWVEGKTEEKIKNLISEDDVDHYTTSILINALFFEGKWQWQFDSHATSKSDFYVDSETHEEVEMMTRSERFNYYECEKLNAKFLELPFEGEDVSMTFVLPNEKDGLSSLEEHIQDVIVPPKYDHSWKVHVSIPKFKAESSIKLNEILEHLGVTTAFSNNAEFTDIVKDKPLKIKKVLQKTFLEVQETGVRAGVSTAAIMEAMSANIYTFVADHPFIYFIKVKDIIIFIGRYVKP